MRIRTASIVAFGLLLLASCKEEVEYEDPDGAVGFGGEGDACFGSEVVDETLAIASDDDEDLALVDSCFNGTISISGPGVTDLSGLSALESVRKLEIRYAPNLPNLDGLGNVRAIGHLSVVSMEQLTTLDGLDNVEYVGQLTIKDNPVLTDVRQLAGVTYLQDLQLESNPAFVDFRGLEDVEYILGPVTINNNDGLTNLAGLDNLAAIDCDPDKDHFVRIDRNDGLTSLEGAPKLERVGCIVFIEDNPELLTCLAAQTIDEIDDMFAPVNFSGNKPGACD